jgi:hypothetical protein
MYSEFEKTKRDSIVTFQASDVELVRTTGPL